MSINKLSFARVAVGALIVGSSPGGKRSVGITAATNPAAYTSPTPLYSILADTFSYSAALLSAASNANAATIAANTTADVNVPYIGVTIGDEVKVTPQFKFPAGASVMGYTMPTSSLGARANTTAYIIGEIVKVTISAVVYAFACTTAGTTGSTAPTNTAPGSLSALDGTVQWTCLGSTGVAAMRFTNCTVGAITISGTLNGLYTVSWTALAHS